ncbi:MAG: polyphosphate kinase 2 family protein, partial [Chloroflexota bacterium]
WYGRVLVERVEKLTPEAEWRRAYRDITDFERTLADDGTLLVKFFLHISKAEQKKRFNALQKDPLTAWHVAPEDWDHHYHYDDWLLAYEEAFERTDTEWGAWTIVEATQRRYTWAKIYRSLIAALEERLGWPALELPAPASDEPSAEDGAWESSEEAAGESADKNDGEALDDGVDATTEELALELQDEPEDTSILAQEA